MNRLQHPHRRGAGRSPHRPWRAVLAAGALALPLAAGAANLSEIYRLAHDNDAQIAAARQAAAAGREREVQARAGLLPNVVLSGNVRQNRDRSTAYDGNQGYESSSVVLSLSQPLFRQANMRNYEQGQLHARLAEQQLLQAEQGLRLRIAQGYFEVLQAEDALATLAAQKEAFAQQLAQARRAYEVGLSPITDVSEAESRYDLTVAQEIAAGNDLELRRSSLEKSIRRELPPLDRLDPAAAVDTLDAGQLARLRDGAADSSLQVAAGLIAEQIARLEIDKQRAGHAPTVDLVASTARHMNTNVGFFGGTDTHPRSIGIEVSVPLYQGGIVDSRTREAAANLARTQSEVEEARRQALLDARQAMLGVQSGSALTRALTQALTSGDTQVRATRRGFEVGVRSRIDVLNAEQQLFTTRRDLSAARYQTLVATLQLRAAAGLLTEEDLRALDRLLKSR